MKFKNAALLMILTAAVPAMLLASDQKDKKASSNKKVWDAGSFTIFMNGKKIGSENFSLPIFFTIFMNGK